MDSEIDIGPTTPAVFTRLESDVDGRPVAVLISRDGEAFCLTTEELGWRIRYLETKNRDATQEREARRQLARAGDRMGF